jgi:hypothetical protein
MKTLTTYCSLEALAATFQLPQHFLRELALRRDIPSLNINGRLRFNPLQVQDALNQLAEKRIAILRERGRTLRKRIKQGKWYRDRTIQAAVIKAVAIILVPFISWFLSSHSNKPCIFILINVSSSSDVGTKGNLSPAIVNSPKITVNINNYLTHSQ